MSCLARSESFDYDPVATRTSLLSRLRNVGDDASWRTFFDTYWRLLYNVSRKSGLSDDDAQDVVQETLIAVARKIPDFRYDPAKGSFKQWLLLITRRRIQTICGGFTVRCLALYQEFLRASGAAAALMSGSGSTTFAVVRGSRCIAVGRKSQSEVRSVLDGGRDGVIQAILNPSQGIKVSFRFFKQKRS